MPRNLRWKWILINVIVLGCLLGFTGLPDSKQALLRNLSRNIRLGLDLRGGSHMVLQVQVQDAFKAEADQVIEQLKRRLAEQSVSYASIERNDPNSIETAETIAIEMRGVSGGDPDQLKRAVDEATQDRWAVQTTGNGGYRLTVRKEAAIVLRQETLAQTIETLERKVNALGVAEASAQQRGGADGEAEVLVQLPGVDDPARVKGILQTAAMLELSEVKGGPYESRAAAQAAHGGVLPPNTKIVRGSSRAGRGRELLAAGSLACRDGARPTGRAGAAERDGRMGYRIRADAGSCAPIRAVYGGQRQQPSRDRAGQRRAERAAHRQ